MWPSVLITLSACSNNVSGADHPLEASSYPLPAKKHFKINGRKVEGWIFLCIRPDPPPCYGSLLRWHLASELSTVGTVESIVSTFLEN